MDKIQQWRVVTGELTHRLNEIYRPNVLFVISSLVYLESVEVSQIDWSQSLLNNLTGCTIRHLSLCGAQMTDVVPVMDDSVVWPLETLKIGLGWDFEFSQDPDGPSLNASNNWNTILRLSSATLKVLVLSHHSAVGNKEEAAISFSLQCSQLRHLDLSLASNLHQSALQSLILTSPKLSTLVIKYAHQATRELLDREGQIERFLETLILCNNNNIPHDSPLDFLKGNIQLKVFAFDGAGNTTLLNHSLSLLTTFSQLQKLSMI